MSEDISSMVRVGTTVILVAALISTVLNLMVMSTSILNSGTTSLQGGLDAISAQEFEPYNNKRVTGTQVKTAVSLFQDRDVAILIRTKNFATKADDADKKSTEGCKFLNIGAVLAKGVGSAQYDDQQKVMSIKGNDETAVQLSVSSTDHKTDDLYFAKVAVQDAEATGTTGVTGDCNLVPGNSYYQAKLSRVNGLIQPSYASWALTTYGNSLYILDSARFTSYLIKDESENTVGIIFEQVK